MKTYKLIEDWNIFFQFLNTDLSYVNKNSIGFRYRYNEIYIRCTDESILKAIRKKYKLTPCKQPDFFFDKDRNWGDTGNTQLFDNIVL